MNASDSLLPLSIVIATYNRAEILYDALESISKQDIMGDSGQACAFEVIVVDNNSTDATYDVVRMWQELIPDLRYENEPEQGVSNARNRGISEARGMHIVFFDDECTVHPDFIKRLSAHLAEHNPVIFGGPVFPRYAAVPAKPKWYRDSYGSFSVFEENTPAEDVWLSGANLGGRCSALRAIGGFSSELGPRGPRMVYGEEQDLVTRAKRRFGSSCVQYFHDVSVFHLVRPEKYSVMSNLFEQWNRGYWRGRVHSGNSKAIELSDGRSSFGVNQARLKPLLADLFKTPIFRNRDLYPFVENYLVDVCGPFVRSVSFYIGRVLSFFLDRMISRMPSSGR